MTARSTARPTVRHRLPVLAEDQLDELLGEVVAVVPVDGGDRVGVHGRAGLREVDAQHRPGRTDDVGDVDQAGVRLVRGDLAQHVGDRQLLADRADVEACGTLRGDTGRTAGDRGRAEDDGGAGIREVGEGADVGGVRVVGIAVDEEEYAQLVEQWSGDGRTSGDSSE